MLHTPFVFPFVYIYIFRVYFSSEENASITSRVPLIWETVDMRKQHREKPETSEDQRPKPKTSIQFHSPKASQQSQDLFRLAQPAGVGRPDSTSEIIKEIWTHDLQKTSNQSPFFPFLERVILQVVFNTYR